MPILLDTTSRILFQGKPNEKMLFHLHQCLAYGSLVVACSSFGDGGKKVLSLPVFDTVQEAKRQTECSMSVIFSDHEQGEDVLDKTLEALDSSIPIVVILHESIPLHDMIEIKRRVSKTGSIVIGPGSSGIISPGKSKASLIPGYLFFQGEVGIVSHSRGVLEEVSFMLTKEEIGQSTVISLGKDHIGISLDGLLKSFERDLQTKAVVLILEEDSLDGSFLLGLHRITKPVFALLVGRGDDTESKELSHVDRILGKKEQTIEKKRDILLQAKVRVKNSPSELLLDLKNTLPKQIV